VILPLYNSLAPLTLNRVAVAAGPFSPTDLPGLQFWLDATTGLYDATSGGSEVTINNSAIARWEDQSGNDNHFIQGTANSQPILKTSAQNGKNVVELDGVNDLLVDSVNDSAYAAMEYAYIFAALKDTDRTGEDGWHIPVFVARGVSGATRFILATRQGGANNFAGAFRKTTEALTVISDTSDANFNALSYILEFSDGSHALRKNKNEIASGTFSAGATANVVSVARAIGGLNNGPPGFFFPGQIAEVFAGTSQLSASEIEAAEQYLINKWGL
jgi:hypothetical protein